MYQRIAGSCDVIIRHYHYQNEMYGYCPKYHHKTLMNLSQHGEYIYESYSKPAFVRYFAIKTDPFIHTHSIIPYCVLFDLILSISVFSFKNLGVKSHPTPLSTQTVVTL